MDLGLADARVIVTGGASNIGRGVVHGFAREGARIVLADRDAEQADRVRTEAADRGAAEVRVVVTDLTTEGAAARVVGDAVEAWGGVDILVNNCGWSVPGFLTELPPEGGVGADSLWAAGRDAIFNADQIEHVTKQTPLRRLTTPDDVAAAVVWLCSPIAARQVTGQVVAVGGGSAMP